MTRLTEITIHGAKFAPKSFEKAEKVSRYGARGVLFVCSGQLFRATLDNYSYSPSVEDADLLRALMNLGYVTAQDVKLAKAAARKRQDDADLTYDLRALSRIASKYGISLTKQQLKQMAKGRQS